MTRRRFTPFARSWGMCRSLTPIRAGVRKSPWPSPRVTVQGAESGRVSQQFVEGALWRALGARHGQGDVPLDVRVGGADSHGALRAVVLKEARPTAGGW